MKRKNCSASARRHTPVGLLLLTSLFMFLTSTSKATGFQTDFNVRGRVTDEKQQPVAGVSIALKGTSTGTSTNENGEYSLMLPNGQGTLVFSSVGFLNQEIPVNGRNQISISLQPDVARLGEVVVVGYGTQRKVNLTGAVSTISHEEITNRQVGQASAALQGLAPDVTVIQNTGQPGQDVGQIRIRGIGTLNNSEPLVLIDGIEGSLNNIDPNLVESISILKDAASSSIYGSRAANGVILVTTKRGRSGRVKVNYNGYAGVQKPTNLPDIVNAMDHMIMTNAAYVNAGNTPLYTDAFLNEYATQGPGNRDKYPDNDWQELLLTGSGMMQSHFVSMSGGSENVRFITSLGYFNQDGLIETSNFRRYTLRNNLDVRISDKLSLKADLQIVHRSMREPGRGTSLVFYYMNRMPAPQPGVFSNGTYGEGWNGNNPIAIANSDGGLRKSTDPNIFANFFLTYKPFKDLQIELNAAPRYNESNDDFFTRAVPTYKWDGSVAYVGVPDRSTLTVTETSSFYNNFRGVATYTKELGNHNFKLLAGASREDLSTRNVSATRTGFVLPDYPVLSAGSSDQQTNTGGASEWALQSFFGRLNYDYKDKYLLEVNGRYDGSSRFAKGKKYGFFPSVSAGWRITEEKFMERLRDKITELKLRASWGQLGNQLIGTYPFVSTIALGSYSMGGQIVNSAALNAMANGEITWETTEMTNVGIDLTLFSKLTITADVYSRTTRDILYNLDVPLTLGLAAPEQNAGVVSNKGWGVGINYRNRSTDWSYDLGFNISDVINKVVDLRGVNRTGITVSREGSPINSIYGYEAIGFFQTDAEALAHAKQFGNTKAGDIKYRDQNKDGLINDEDLVIIGSTIPRYTYSALLNGSYKNFNISIFFQGVGKADGYMYEQGIMPFFNGGTVHEQHKDYWRPDNTDAKFPRLAWGESNNEKNSSFWMKDASYLRLKTLQIGYALPASLLKKAGISGARIYVSGQNLLTWDNFWDGYDVETPVSTGTIYPQVKLYSVGLDLNF